MRAKQFCPFFYSVLVLIFTLFQQPFATAEVVNGNKWKVERDDTLYSIGRALFPGDNAMQGKARHDIMLLNPDVFQNGPKNIKVGSLLNLPDYVGKHTEKPKSPPVPAIEPGDTWKIKQGDTLYAISRALFPGDVTMQAKVRRDIRLLNPEVFQNGAKNIKVGTLLNLPDYVSQHAAKPKSPPVPTAEPTPAVIPLPAPPSQLSVTPEEPPAENLEAAPIVEKAIENKVSHAVETKQSPVSELNYSWALTIGYSEGGDKLVSISGHHDISSHNINAGSGAHVRVGFDAIPTSGSGYRIALGYRYDRTKAGNGDASLSDLYLQTAYQYRANTLLYGAGIVTHPGPKLTVNTTNITSSRTTDFKSAVGLLLYLEYIGDGKGNALGASYTSIKYKVGGTSTQSSFNGSQVELYYSWKF
jgi:LysM repeat protein